ncbi:MAG: tetratricopeptide repeat protein [Vulcanimicrobiota bacterium]
MATPKFPWNPVWIVFWAALLVHLPSLAGGFVYDDHYEILGDGFLKQSNPWLAFRLNLWDLYSLQSSAVSPYYRPMARIMLWLPYQLVGPQPLLFHLDNVLCHALNCALVAYLSALYFRSPRVTLISGLLFALHPRHVEPLAWPTAICELFCWTGALVYLVSCHLAAGSGKWRWWMAAFFGLLLSGLTKESGILAGGLGLLGPWLNVPERSAVERRRGLLGALAVCLAAGLVYAFLRVGVGQVHMPSTQGDPFWQRLTQGVYIFAALAGLAAWPFGFGLFRGPFLDANPAHWQWWLALCFLLFYVVAVLISWRRHRRLCFCLLWWGYLAAPVTGVLAPLPSLLSDRHIYMGLAAWGWLWAIWEEGNPRPPLRGLLVAFGLVYSVLTWQQIRVWCDEVSLWQQSKQHCPTNTVPRNNLGAALIEQNRLPEAAAEYDELIRFGPDLPDGYLGKARTQMAAGDNAGAEATLVGGLRRGVRPDLSLRESLGQVLLLQKRFDLAAEVFKSCLAQAPDKLSLHFSLANALAQAQRFAEARGEYQTILDRYQRSPATVHNLQLLDLNEAEFRLSHGEQARADECLRRLLSDGNLDVQIRQRAEALLRRAEKP